MNWSNIKCNYFLNIFIHFISIKQNCERRDKQSIGPRMKTRNYFAANRRWFDGCFEREIQLLKKIVFGHLVGSRSAMCV
jgi:hypothetical protein